MQVVLSKNFRENVRQILQSRGVSENQFWKNAGLGSGTYFNQVMNGKSIPSLDYCESVAAALDVSVSELLAQPELSEKSELSC